MTYGQIRTRLSNLDLINCLPSGWFWSAIGHTASIYKNHDIDQVDVFESTQRSCFGKSGVQLNTASEWFKRYKGKVFVRRIVNSKMTLKELRQMDALDNKFIQHTRDMKYPNLRKRSGRWKLLASALDWCLPSGKDVFHSHSQQGIFCTQLTVARYIYDGLTIYEAGNLELALKLAAEWQPDDTRVGGKLEKILKPTVKFGREVEVK